MRTRFTLGLSQILPKPCFDRPFVCVGQPETCTAVLIGENPATTIGVDWWTFWNDDTGFDFDRWDELYRESRRRQGKSEISPTRRRINRLRHAGVKCLEANSFMNERLLGHGAGKSNADLLDHAIGSLPNISAVIAHGNEAQAFVASMKAPARIRIFATKHFRLLSYAAIDELAAQIRAA